MSELASGGHQHEAYQMIEAANFGGRPRGRHGAAETSRGMVPAPSLRDAPVRSGPRPTATSMASRTLTPLASRPRGNAGRSGPAAAARPAQNWILTPFQDSLFIIAAPLIVLGLALSTFLFLSPAESTSCIIVAHVIFTVAHHGPTFIRIYGDVDLFRRFKWSFVFGPLIPFTFALGVLAYINYHHYPLENFFYLLIILALWDPWHFLMQHYGFMRIYDRPNTAPRPLASPMDLALCASWFAYIMLASGGWLPEILHDLYARSHLPIIFAVPLGALPLLRRIALGLALIATVAYGVYLIWCRQRGYFISAAKLTLFAITFGVMALTYTPNPWILRLAPGWTFKAGFAVLGIVHVTQYMAIVWRYNRSLALRPERSRAGLFRTLHLRGGWLIAAVYVVICLAYGDLLTTVHDNRWLMSFMLALGFTSTLMHYYFDGFIWKVRHQQNVENLAMDRAGVAPVGSPSQMLASWWGSVRAVPAYAIFFRQCLYFGLPMVILTLGAWMVWSRPVPNYLAHMQKADAFHRLGKPDETLREAQLALVDMETQLPLVAKTAELEPTSAHEAEYAELIYTHSVAEQFSIPALMGEQPSPGRFALHLVQVEAAIDALERAIKRGGALGYPGRENMSLADARRSLETWHRVAEQCRRQSRRLATSP